MPYLPPHKRDTKPSKEVEEWITPMPRRKAKPEEFPALSPVKKIEQTTSKAPEKEKTPSKTNVVNYASICKKEDPVEKEVVRKIPIGMVLLTPKGIFDGLSEKEKERDTEVKQIYEKSAVMRNLYKHSIHLEAQKEMRRNWDPNYYGEESYLSYSDESVTESEESYLPTDEDEFEPEK